MSKWFWFRCPDCKESGLMDEDQAYGRVSIQCETEGCSFHETGRVLPLMSSTELLKPNQEFTLEGVN